MEKITLTLLQLLTIKSTVKFDNISHVVANEDYTIVYLHQPVNRFEIGFASPLLATEFRTVTSTEIIISMPCDGYDEAISIHDLLTSEIEQFKIDANYRPVRMSPPQNRK